MKIIDVVAEKLRRERRFFFEQMRQEPQRRLKYWQRLRDERRIQRDVLCPDCPLALEHDNAKIASEVMKGISENDSDDIDDYTLGSIMDTNGTD